MDSRTGELLTQSELERGVYIWEVNNPLCFKLLREDYGVMGLPYDEMNIRIMFNNCVKRKLEIHKCFLDLKIFLHSQSQNWRFFRAFKFLMMSFLNSIGSISILSVQTAINKVLLEQFVIVSHFEIKYDIKFNLY
ncbi:replication enhancer [Soybean mild mottle virus]|uniref:Replication enhancer n=1 Tax=Soybean mild mottle virus TaxID=761701 RepID=D6MTW1_9GEMI|nr:replication enhancer [Soybean mild mottle virus]ADG36413.1 replication enhancer [Soybean mild mottle virus]